MPSNPLAPGNTRTPAYYPYLARPTPVRLATSNQQECRVERPPTRPGPYGGVMTPLRSATMGNVAPYGDGRGFKPRLAGKSRGATPWMLLPRRWPIRTRTCPWALWHAERVFTVTTFQTGCSPRVSPREASRLRNRVHTHARHTLAHRCQRTQHVRTHTWQPAPRAAPHADSLACAGSARAHTHTRSLPDKGKASFVPTR